MLQMSTQVSIDSTSAGQTIPYTVQRNVLSGWRAVPLFQSHHPKYMTIAALLIKLEIKLSPMVLDMYYVLPVTPPTYGVSLQP